MLLSKRWIQAFFASSAIFIGLPHVGAQISPPITIDNGVVASPFDISQVTLGNGRLKENEARTLTYLKFVDPERMLYVFRKNHGLSTNNAAANGGWDAPTFPFRSHVQGHILSAWSQCYASYKDTTCRDRALSFTLELAKCQANNAAAGFKIGYLSGFPESDFDKMENDTLTNGNVPYYVTHKTMQGLLDVWRHIGDANAKSVLLSLASWVDVRTSKLTYAKMQSVLQREFGGMNDILTDIYRQTGDPKWLIVARRFDHALVFAPLEAGIDALNGLHANTQVPKWIGAIREYKATGNISYYQIAKNAFDITLNSHTYAIGGNSQAEHFHAPNIIAGYLTTDTCEHCNSYNMLKLTKELWTTGGSSTPGYFDFYERVLYNHLLGAQNHSHAHGPVTYFTPLIAGGHKGSPPGWDPNPSPDGYSTDYESFWCCQGTGLEQNTKLMDAIYGYDNSSLYVNLFAPSTLNWSQKRITIKQATQYPVEDTATLTISGAGTFDLKIRIPSWTSGARIVINGKNTVSGSSGTYATISRTWIDGDTVTVTLPMALRLVAANDDATLAAIAYGPTVLAGNYGSSKVSAAPTINLGSLTKTAGTLNFAAVAGNAHVNLGPFYDAQDFNYVVYWRYNGSLPAV